MDAKPPHAFGEYARAILAFAQHDVEFVICGDVASVFHGVPRVTADIDILVRLTDGNLQRFVKAAQELGLKPRAPVPLESICVPEQRKAWMEEKQAKVMTFVSPNSPLQVDILLHYPFDFDTVYNDARIGELEGHAFRVSSIEHLIHVKEAIQPPRENDAFDLQHLRRLLKHD